MREWGGWFRRRSLIKEVIADLLRKKIDTLTTPELNVMVDVAEVDFINYMLVEENILYEKGGVEQVRDYVEYLLEERPFLILPKLNEWLDVWIWKWRQRVKLIMGEMKEEERIEIEVQNKLRSVLPKIKNLEEYRRFTVGSLIKANEVCFTSVLADSLVKGAIIKFFKSASPEKVAEIVNNNPVIILEEIIKRIKSLKKFKGNLVVVKVSSNIFSSHAEHILEW